MRKLLYSGLAVTVIGGIAFAQSVGWPPPAGMLAALGVYNSGGITLTNTQVSPLQLDASGNLKVTAGGGGGGAVTQGTVPWVVSGQGTAGTAATGVVTVQGISSMTKLLVTPDSVALPANQSVNVAQINGVTPLMGNGATGTGSPRVTIANDSAGLINTTNVTPTNCSGTITTGGTAQNAFSAGATKSGFTIMNLSTDVMWVSFTTTAAADTAGSYLLNPASATTAGGSYTTPFGFGMNTALSVIGATTGNKFTCTWW